jgi:hypothetical protein
MESRASSPVLHKNLMEKETPPLRAAFSVCAEHVRQLEGESPFHNLINPPNRRMRTRMSGGVGGGKPRSFPLSRLMDGTG